MIRVIKRINNDLLIIMFTHSEINEFVTVNMNIGVSMSFI